MKVKYFEYSNDQNGEKYIEVGEEKFIKDVMITEIAGYTYHSCTVCGHTEKVEDFDATGHTENDWIIDSEADGVTPGSKHKECIVCGKVLASEVTLPQTGNNSPKTVTTALAVFALALLGAYAVVKSGVLRKKEDEQ